MLAWNLWLYVIVTTSEIGLAVRDLSRRTRSGRARRG